MRISLSPMRPLLLLVFAAALLTVVIDGGSVMMTQIKIPDELKAVGQAAATAVENQPVNPQTARTAFEVASQEARPVGLVVKAKTFTLYPDGQVSLTGTRTAPTLLLERIDALKHLASVTSTTTVSPPPYS